MRPWSEQLEGLAKAAAAEAAAVFQEIKTERAARRPGSVDRLSGAAEKLSRAANSWTVTAQRMRECEQAIAQQQARLAREEAELLASIFSAFLAALGLQHGAGRRVIAQLARQASAGEPLLVDPADVERLEVELLERAAAIARGG